MTPLLSIVGWSSAGKTELLCKLVSGLKSRGYRVAAIKHTPHGFQVDIPGKDSWRLLEAGSDAVVVSSPERMARFAMVDRDKELEELASDLGASFDIVIGEGFKSTKAPKIEVYSKGEGKGLMCQPAELVAIATDEPLDVPVWQCSRDDAPKIIDLVVKRFLRKEGEDEVFLTVNGSSVPVGSFMKKIIVKVLVGMASALKEVEEVRSLEISIRPGKSN
ncbi:MAG: molybdopterin-guanine dinucleotide biosynthesis protein B [Chloroflexi bacterium]|nr:molybdopterin-guanine dinucleotide biosynthesis protein B [Chloroflexota bacterium]